MDGGPPGQLAGARDSLGEDVVFLERYGANRRSLEWAQARATAFGVTPATSLVANGLVSESDYYRCVALELGLDFTTDIRAHGQSFFTPPDARNMRRMGRMIQVDDVGDDDRVSQFNRKNLRLAPDCSKLSDLKIWLRDNEDLTHRLKITTLSANLAALERRFSSGLLAQAVDGLRNRFPSLSARQVWTPRQAVVLLLVIQLLFVWAFFSTPTVFLFLHLIATFFFLGCVIIRVLAASSFDAQARKPPDAEEFRRNRDHGLPFYSIIVPLFQEQNQIPALIEALSNIDWPRERLEIKLACETQDLETIKRCRDVIEATRINHASVVEVPPGGPQTKPKALAYTLPLCRGDLVVVYDAEDRPDPMQLREAFAKFSSGASNLACLQAPLMANNSRDSWFSRMFSIEYSALFDGLLPTIARSGSPMPLGGTSNHFRRSALEHLGGWDPYNVTEDADLGIRLARAGYRTGTLTLPTYEEAPIAFGVWLKQRTRWFKGWYQTWLVHMRYPLITMRDLGFWNFIVFQLMIGGMALSALVHPLLLYFIAADLTGFINTGEWRSVAGPLIGLDITTVLLGYFSFALLAWRTLPVRGLSGLRPWLITIPFYWLVLSIAAWRALWQLVRRPHFWEKTPHGLSRQTIANDTENASTQPA